MHQAYTDLSHALQQACQALIEQYGAPDSVSSPYSRVAITRQEYRISAPRLELRTRDNEWQRLDSGAPGREWLPAAVEDLQEAERVIAELAVLAANGEWLRKTTGSIRRLKAIVKALETG